MALDEQTDAVVSLSMLLRLVDLGRLAFSKLDWLDSLSAPDELAAVTGRKLPEATDEGLFRPAGTPAAFFLGGANIFAALVHLLLSGDLDKGGRLIYL